ncbi:hypothetical protein JCM10449v2_003628 [Rhodotorula kratochvilovae]
MLTSSIHPKVVVVAVSHTRRRGARQERPVKNDSTHRRAGVGRPSAARFEGEPDDRVPTPPLTPDLVDDADNRFFRGPPAAPAEVPLGQGAALDEVSKTPCDDALEALRQGEFECDAEDAAKAIATYHGYTWQTRVLDVRIDVQDTTGALVLAEANRQQAIQNQQELLEQRTRNWPIPPPPPPPMGLVAAPYGAMLVPVQGANGQTFLAAAAAPPPPPPPASDSAASLYLSPAVVRTLSQELLCSVYTPSRAASSARRAPAGAMPCGAAERTALFGGARSENSRQSRGRPSRAELTSQPGIATL